MSDAIDRHLAEALASLEAVPVRELEETAEALEHRRDGLRDFAGIFRNVAHAREGGWDTKLPRFHLGQAVSRDDEEFIEQIEDALARFWQHVREALLAHREAEEVYWKAVEDTTSGDLTLGSSRVIPLVERRAG